MAQQIVQNKKISSMLETLIILRLTIQNITRLNRSNKLKQNHNKYEHQLWIGSSYSFMRSTVKIEKSYLRYLNFLHKISKTDIKHL